MRPRRFTRCLLLACLLPSACTPPPADLAVSSVTGPPGPVKAADTWTLGCVVANLGESDAPDTTVRFFYSADAILDAGDATIGDANVPALAPSASYAATYSPTYKVSDSGGTAGTHWIFTVVDPSSMVADGDPANNGRSLPVQVRYEHFVIDTYHPTATGSLGITNTIASLYDGAGILLADDDEGNPYYLHAARIGYADAAGLVPGTVLYVSVEGNTPSPTGLYAIRLVLAAPETTYYPLGVENPTDSPYEVDDAATGNIPTSPVLLTVGQKLSRALGTGDLDWFQLVLP